MKLPEELKYTAEHEWVRVHSDGVSVTIGITDFAQGELGDIVFIELEPEGETLEQGDVFGSVEAVKAVSDLFLPVSGTINQHNAELETNPELVNSDPFGEGWIIEVSLSDPTQIESLLSAQEYADHVA
ncbi:MAG: glycine cleavage system protein GcvH [Rhodothermaceae bacterium]|nr:glycine cleavage system protein GcvH [Bacteroidota bacterium]MXW14955.1 glycine cleavage system protein GcvH [Rhodothermaceae bacterium]MDE2644690.1 glycine cleavage system protein GcvH [Bacteroidota bacterium]MXW33597.1 glycine cleavage system protein GcvH [Rhodothermaceae bacterium]MXX97512.1 glycine cleavage system protein GcvH [Rhodothermaceae bacterium]